MLLHGYIYNASKPPDGLGYKKWKKLTIEQQSETLCGLMISPKVTRLYNTKDLAMCLDCKRMMQVK